MRLGRAVARRRARVSEHAEQLCCHLRAGELGDLLAQGVVYGDRDGLEPLRERAEDIPELAQFLFAKMKEKHGRPDLRLPNSLLPLFRGYDWPGNVRELKNAIERAMILEEEPVLRPVYLPFSQKMNEERKNKFDEAFVA